jgi:hypothetical protein
MVMTRSVTQTYRLTRLLYRYTRPRYFNFVRRIQNPRIKHTFLLVYAPGSLLLLILIWAAFIILGFALINFGFGFQHGSSIFSFGEAFYYSGVTFLTLGYGDLAPTSGVGRAFAVVEAGSGFVFLAGVIGYLPVIYGSVQRREIPITMLDSKASSNPTGFELIRRHAAGGAMGMLPYLLERYEEWGAEMLEAYLNYPIAAFYRSQHDDQNWVKSATAIMDACAIIRTSIQPSTEQNRLLIFQAGATFAALRHVMVDLAYIVWMEPVVECSKRLELEDYQWMLSELSELGVEVQPNWEGMTEMRSLYEPYSVSLGDGLIMDVPEWRRKVIEPDNWQIAAWDGGRHPKPDASETETK